MHFATLVTLILVTILILAIRLLFTFSYDTFIPKYMEFGIVLYFASLFIVYLLREFYFYNTNESQYKRFNYIYIPALISLTLAILVFSYFEIPTGPSISDAPTGAWVEGIIIISGFVILLAFVFFIQVYSAENRFSRFSTEPFVYDGILRKSSVFTIPLLIISIGFVIFLTYSDYASAGMNKSYTNKSNADAILERSIAEQDISYCDHIINTRDISYSTERCYIEFFEQVEDIQKLINNKKRIKLPFQNYLLVYYKFNQQCQKTIYPAVCNRLLSRETDKFFRLFINYTIINKNDARTPKYLLIDNFRNINQQEFHNHLINDLKKFIPNPISIVKIFPSTTNKTKTKLYIDLEKLANNPTDFKTIENIIAKREQYSYEEQIKKNKLARKQTRLKREKEKLDFENDIRKKYNISSNAVIQPCKDNQHYKCHCAVPMCANNEYIFDLSTVLKKKLDGYSPVFIPIGKVKTSEFDPITQCLKNYREGHNPCDNVEPEYKIKIHEKKQMTPSTFFRVF